MSEFRKNFNELEVGYIPEKFNFTYVKKEDNMVDWNKLQYNSLYKNPLFYLNRFSNPTAFLNLPCSQVILQEMVDNSLTPLEEHNYIKLCNTIIIEEPK